MQNKKVYVHKSGSNCGSWNLKAGEQDSKSQLKTELLDTCIIRYTSTNVAIKL